MLGYGSGDILKIHLDPVRQKKMENWVYIHIRYTVLSKDLYLKRLQYVKLTKIDIVFRKGCEWEWTGTSTRYTSRFRPRLTQPSP
jgi:hypothetical protein